MRIWAVLVAGVVAIAGQAQAGTVDFKDVPAEAKWVAHVDVDAMRDSIVVRNAYEKAVERFGWAEMLIENATNEWGTDPRQDLHSMTFYGTGFVPEQFILIAKMEVDTAKLLAKANQAPEHKVTQYGKYELHTWKERRGSRHEHTATALMYKSGVFVVGASIDQVKKAIDVLDGKAESLAGKKSPLSSDVTNGTIVLARAMGLDKANLPIKSPVLKGTEQLCIQIGEAAGDSFFQGQLAVADKETAEQIKALVEGVRAFVLLQHGHEEGVKSILSGLAVEQSDKTVQVKFKTSADNVWEAVKRAAVEVEKHRNLLPRP